MSMVIILSVFIVDTISRIKAIDILCSITIIIIIITVVNICIRCYR